MEMALPELVQANTGAHARRPTVRGLRSKLANHVATGLLRNQVCVPIFELALLGEIRSRPIKPGERTGFGRAAAPAMPSAA